VKEIQIHRLRPMQISRRWAFVRDAYRRGLGDFRVRHESAYTAVLAHLMDERMQFWMGVVESDGEPNVAGTLFTRVMQDATLGARRLAIVAAEVRVPLHPTVFDSILSNLEMFADSSGCDTIEAMTRHYRLKQALKRSGFDEKMTFYSKERT